ncbi:MAG: flagellar assembly protein FliW [Sporomusaceae bacterium]|nr:flagellar assembly protein FliW [Sporomusaceae bacterium]
MIIQSTRFGELEILEEMIIEFSQGLPGFSTEKSFAFLPYQLESPFAFLQSVNEPNLTFMVVEPFTFFKDYVFEIDDEIAKGAGISNDNIPQIFNIVSVRDKVEEMTANLLAPIIINWRDRKGMQLILEKTSYTIRHRLFPDGLPGSPSKGGE